MLVDDKHSQAYKSEDRYGTGNKLQDGLISSDHNPARTEIGQERDPSIGAPAPAVGRYTEQSRNEDYISKNSRINNTQKQEETNSVNLIEPSDVKMEKTKSLNAAS